MTDSSASLRAERLPASSPNLDTLVPHLLAAKRSLSCVEYVSRANDLVTSTRQALETHTILTARTIFIGNGCKAQISTLDHVYEHDKNIAREAGDDFHEVIDKLDAAESKLRNTLDLLRSTLVDSKLRHEGEEPKYLADFVDETGVQTLMDNIRQSIDSTGRARKTFDQAIEALDGEIVQIKELLASEPETSDTLTLTNSHLRSPVPDILQSMEIQAGEMARNLESLVKHFDLCVTAIKHTEGGGAAASELALDLPDGMNLNISADDGPLERIDDQEMRDMLEVLEKDAGEVEEVVLEIKEAISEVEANAERVKTFGQRLANELSRTIAAFNHLEDLGSRLPGYITQSQIFIYRWDEDRGKIDEYMDDLEGLRDFYSSFINAYDNLLIEVGRRKDVEKRIAKIRQEAMAKIERLVQEETSERQAFRQEQGDFLPVDIWPGLVTAPTRYEISKVDGAADSIPDISASVINKAIKRVSAQRKDLKSSVK
ncbi:autophagy protein 17 [Thelotrema lepadinum]|nr:autophagy protein 17 [Thelotrema lepadinum]